MSRAMPNSESIPIVLGLLRAGNTESRQMKTDGSSVNLRGSKIVRVTGRGSQDEPSTWTVEVNLCGWGDTRTTRNCINSVLCRLNLPYRVGMHKHASYLYKITPGAEPDSGKPVPILTLPENGWVTLPRQEEQ